jgi:hypothetical protein
MTTRPLRLQGGDEDMERRRAAILIFRRRDALQRDLRRS